MGARWGYGQGNEHRWAPGGMLHLGPAPTVSVPVELQAHLQDGCPEPEYQIRLCFGEEYPGPPDQPEERLIMAHVEPVFARELLLHSKRHSHSAPAATGSQSLSPNVSLT